MSATSNELNYSDFDIFKINLPDGSTRIFYDEQSFNDFCDSWSACSSVINSIFSPSVLSSAISTVLGVSPPSVLSSF
jgi:hypothetical protein